MVSPPLLSYSMISTFFVLSKRSAGIMSTQPIIPPGDCFTYQSICPLKLYPPRGRRILGSMSGSLCLWLWHGGYLDWDMTGTASVYQNCVCIYDITAVVIVADTHPRFFNKVIIVIHVVQMISCVSYNACCPLELYARVSWIYNWCNCHSSCLLPQEHIRCVAGIWANTTSLWRSASSTSSFRRRYRSINKWLLSRYPDMIIHWKAEVN